MGTGSTFSNGSGSKSGGGFGNSSGNDGYGYHWENGKLFENTLDVSKIKKMIRNTLVGLKGYHKAYFSSVFADPLVQAAYKGLFELHKVSRSVQKDMSIGSLEAFSQEYNIPLDTPGFLKQWIKLVVGNFPDSEVRIQSAVTETLDEFLLTALGNDISLYLNGTANEVFSRLDERVFASTSANFLRFYLDRIIRRELAGRPTKDTSQHLSKACESVANELVDKYKELFPSDGYSRLFSKIAETPEWFQNAIEEIS